MKLKKLTSTLVGTVLAASMGFSGNSFAADPFLGQVTFFAGNFAPRGRA